MFITFKFSTGTYYTKPTRRLSVDQSQKKTPTVKFFFICSSLINFIPNAFDQTSILKHINSCFT